MMLPPVSFIDHWIVSFSPHNQQSQDDTKPQVTKWGRDKTLTPPYQHVHPWSWNSWIFYYSLFPFLWTLYYEHRYIWCCGVCKLNIILLLPLFMLLSAVKNKHARDNRPDIFISCPLHTCCVFRLPTSIGNSVRLNWPHLTGESQQFIHTVGP